MSRPRLTRKGARLIRAFENAAKQYEVIGAMDPDDWDEITAKYKQTKRALQAYVSELERARPDCSEI